MQCCQFLKKKKIGQKLSWSSIISPRVTPSVILSRIILKILKDDSEDHKFNKSLRRKREAEHIQNIVKTPPRGRCAWLYLYFQ